MSTMVGYDAAAVGCVVEEGSSWTRWAAAMGERWGSSGVREKQRQGGGMVGEGRRQLW